MKFAAAAAVATLSTPALALFGGVGSLPSGSDVASCARVLAKPSCSNNNIARANSFAGCCTNTWLSAQNETDPGLQAGECGGRRAGAQPILTRSHRPRPVHSVLERRRFE